MVSTPAIVMYNCSHIAFCAKSWWIMPFKLEDLTNFCWKYLISDKIPRFQHPNPMEMLQLCQKRKVHSLTVSGSFEFWKLVHYKPSYQYFKASNFSSKEARVKFFNRWKLMLCPNFFQKFGHNTLIYSLKNGLDMVASFPYTFGQVFGRWGVQQPKGYPTCIKRSPNSIQHFSVCLSVEIGLDVEQFQNEDHQCW